MSEEEILIAIKEIKCRYSLPALEINFTDRDYAIKQFERLVIHLANQQEKKDKEIENLKEELEFEKTTNKELISTGAELENKLYEEQDKNKRLKKELQEEIEEKEHYQAIVESWE